MTSILRRVTLPVTAETMERSLGYYQHVLGMSVFYDQVQEGDTVGALLGFDGRMRIRMVVLQQGDSTVGMVGLIQYIDPPFAIPRFDRSAGAPYPLYMIFTAKRLDGIRVRAEDFGARIPLPPVLTRGPDRETVRALTTFAPTGVWTCTADCAPGGDDEARVGPLRMVALPVPNGELEAIVRFYQKVLGLQADRDAMIELNAEESTLDVGDVRAHLISLTSGVASDGLVGFVEYIEPRLPVPKLVKEANGVYPVVFVYLTDEMDAIHRRAMEAGAEIVCPPFTWSIVGRGPTREMTFLDPRGVVINLVENVPQGD